MRTFAPGMLLVVIIIKIITEQMSKMHANLIHRILGRETSNPLLSRFFIFGRFVFHLGDQL